MKHLVTSGCSFSETWPENPIEGQTWADYLAPMLSRKLHNVAMTGAGNHIISSAVIKKVKELLDNNTRAEDIYVVVQWSGIYRFDRIVPKKISLGAQRQVSVENRSTGKKRFIAPESDNEWIMCAAARNESIWPYLFSFMSKEQAFMETVENILRVQWFLKSNSIKYKMFNAWDIFTDGLPKYLGANYTCDLVLNHGNQFSENGDYTNINHTMLKENCKWVGYLFDYIDWQNFWTYNNEKIKYGGMTQWVLANVPKQHWYRKKDDQHPPNYAAQQFAQKVLRKIIEKDE